MRSVRGKSIYERVFIWLLHLLNENCSKISDVKKLTFEKRIESLTNLPFYNKIKFSLFKNVLKNAKSKLNFKSSKRENATKPNKCFVFFSAVEVFTIFE